MRGHSFSHFICPLPLHPQTPKNQLTEQTNTVKETPTPMTVKLSDIRRLTPNAYKYACRCSGRPFSARILGEAYAEERDKYIEMVPSHQVFAYT